MSILEWKLFCIDRSIDRSVEEDSKEWFDPGKQLSFLAGENVPLLLSLSLSLSLPLYTSFLSLSSFCFKIHLYFLTLSLTYTLCFSLLSLHFLSLSLFLQYALIALSLSFSLSFNHSISCLLFTLFTILTFSYALISLSCTLCYLIILFLSLRQMNFLPVFSTLTQKEGEVFIWNFGFRG